MRELTVAAGVVRALMDFAISKGASRAALAHRVRIDRTHLDDPDRRIPFSKYVALMREGKELCKDPALALHFGETGDASAMSAAHAVGGATNFADAIMQANRYASLGVEVDTNGAGERFQLSRIDGQLWLVDARLDPNAFPELTESTFARMVCSTRRLAGGDARIVSEVHVTHAEPRAPVYRAEYDRIFRAPVTFGSTRNALRIDEAPLSRVQFPQPSPYVSRIVRAHAETLLARLDRTQSMRVRVERLVTPMLHDGDVTSDAIARALGVSRQTLFRRLRAEGVTFAQLLDDLRHKLAVDYLGVSKASVKQTARLVGYSDPSAFSRAFKRWTGRSPRTYASVQLSSAALE